MVKGDNYSMYYYLALDTRNGSGTKRLRKMSSPEIEVRTRSSVYDDGVGAYHDISEERLFPPPPYFALKLRIRGWAFSPYFMVYV